MTYCEHSKYIILICLYFILVLLELVCTSFLIDNNQLIKNVLRNETFKIQCKSDRINTFDDGVLYQNTFAFLIMLSIMISIILINIFYNKKKSNVVSHQINDHGESKPLLNLINEHEEESKSLLNLIKTERIELTFNIILIMSIIGFFVLNISQLVLQSYNVSIDCIKLIDNNINGFFLIYSALECCCAFIVTSFFLLMYSYF